MSKNNYDNFQEENFLSPLDKKNSFVLPKDYFNSLSARIVNKMEHEQELEEFKTLSENRQLKFTVPQNYFNDLVNILELKYEASLFPELDKIKKPTLKKLPSDYFESLNKKVQDKMEVENELKDFYVLSSIPKKNSFKAANNYFESSPETVKEKIQTEAGQKGVVRQLFATIFNPKMAVAASFALLVGISSIWYYNKTKTGITPNGDCLTLACLEKNEILNEKNIQDFDDENLYEMVDVEALDQQLSGETKSEDSLKKNKE